jgi:hypothetical protein
LARGGKAAKEEIEEFQKYNKNLFDCSFFLLSFTPSSLFKNGSFNQLRRLSFGIKAVQEDY